MPLRFPGGALGGRGGGAVNVVGGAVGVATIPFTTAGSAMAAVAGCVGVIGGTIEPAAGVAGAVAGAKVDGTGIGAAGAVVKTTSIPSAAGTGRGLISADT